MDDAAGVDHFRLPIDAVIDYAVYMVGLDGRVQSWNAEAVRLKGYTAEEIVGHSFSRFYTPEDQKRGLPQLALETARQNGRFATEGWRVRKDGTRFWALAVIDAMYSNDGTLVGFAKITRDFTEREEAQQNLLEAERRYRRLVESVVDYAIFQLDPSGCVATWNFGALRIKGYTADEIIGQHFSRFYTEEDRANGLPQRALQTAAAEGRYESEGWRVRKDGTKFWASVIIDPILEEGKLVGFAKVTRDITDRYKAQQDLKETQEQLALSQKMEAVGQLSGGIAHDFNNLLMIVQGNLETAQRHARHLPAAVNLQRSINNAMRGVQRATALTSRLLAFSRRQPLNPKPLDVNKFIAGAVDFLQRSLGERVEIEAVGSAGLWPIEVDVNHLETALVNLAINARDAMPQGGKLTIEAANMFADAEYVRANPEVESGQYVVISVTDSGTGMSGETLSRVFEPFYTTKEIGQGTGLGLSQVYGFAKQSGGHVKIYSEVGQGTTVHLYFPRFTGQDAEFSDANEDSIAETGENETILVVEDDADLRGYLGDLLRGLNYRVIMTGNAQAALTILLQAERRVDLMLTDIVMSGIDGRELGRRAHDMRPSLPILYMTGYSKNAVIHQGRLEEGIDLLQKPVTQPELAARIRAMLDRAQRTDF
jgi:PAS domain S-box-containing protein